MLRRLKRVIAQLQFESDIEVWRSNRYSCKKDRAAAAEAYRRAVRLLVEILPEEDKNECVHSHTENGR
jgi:hypothetical protein